MQLTGNVRKFVNHWSRKEDTGKEKQLRSRESSEAMIRISKTRISIRTLTLARKAIISLDEG